jgi:hypothetical protein
VIPNSIVDAEPDEPAKRQIEVEPLHQLSLGADREERLQKHRTQQLLRRDRRASERRIKLLKRPGQIGQRLVHDEADGAQRMRNRDPILKINIREKTTRFLIHPRIVVRSIQL